MFLARIPSLLFLLWAFLAATIWWGKLKSPALFLVAALLIGLGSQTVSSVIWAMLKATNNQFLAVPAEEVQVALIYDLAFHAIATFGIVAPIYWLLSKRL